MKWTAAIRTAALKFSITKRRIPMQAAVAVPARGNILRLFLSKAAFRGNRANAVHPDRGIDEPYFFPAGAVYPRHCAWTCDRGLQKGGEEMTELLKAFLVGGLLCVIGQLLIDKTKLMSGRILVLYVCIGCILGGLGIYQKIEGFGGAGATDSAYGLGFALRRGL